jgi:ribonuclease D
MALSLSCVVASVSLPPPVLVTTPAELDAAVAAIRRAGRLALDTESNSLYAYHDRVCLIQISTDVEDYLIDPLTLPDLKPLGELVAQPGLEVTMHAAENDILLLRRDFGWRFAAVFDTLWAARILGWRAVGLASLLATHFGVALDKRMQRTNWGRRPLTPEQIAYARLDTHFLLPLRDRQEAELRACGRWQEAQEVFAGLLTIAWEEKGRPGFWRLPGVWQLEPGQQAVLKALFDWREETAARRDVPPFKVLSNEALLALARQQPTTPTALTAVPGLPRRLSPGLIQELLRVIERGRRQPPPPPPEHNHGGLRPDRQTLARFERLRAWRAATAAHRGVEPDVVLTNQVLMALARACPTTMAELEATRLLGPAKLRSYGPDILRVLRDTP